MELLFKRLAWGDPLAQEERDRIVASVLASNRLAPVKPSSPLTLGLILAPFF